MASELRTRLAFNFASGYLEATIFCCLPTTISAASAQPLEAVAEAVAEAANVAAWPPPS
jgi:hypothetical protein